MVVCEGARGKRSVALHKSVGCDTCKGDGVHTCTTASATARAGSSAARVRAPAASAPRKTEAWGTAARCCCRHHSPAAAAARGRTAEEGRYPPPAAAAAGAARIAPQCRGCVRPPKSVLPLLHKEAVWKVPHPAGKEAAAAAAVGGAAAGVQQKAGKGVRAMQEPPLVRRACTGMQ